MNYEMKMTITKNGLAQLFEDCLCSWSIGYGVLKLDMLDSLYTKARQELLKQEDKDSVCVEEVISQGLRMGFPVQIEDTYSDEKFEVTLLDMYKNFENVKTYLLKRMMNHEDDACTHDSILQTLILGEETYC